MATPTPNDKQKNKSKSAIGNAKAGKNVGMGDEKKRVRKSVTMSERKKISERAKEVKAKETKVVVETSTIADVEKGVNARMSPPKILQRTLNSLFEKAATGSENEEFEKKKVGEKEIDGAPDAGEEVEENRPAQPQTMKEDEVAARKVKKHGSAKKGVGAIVSENTGDNNPVDDANVKELSDHGGSDEGGDTEKQDERIASAAEEEGEDDSSMDDDDDAVAIAARKVEVKKHVSAKKGVGAIVSENTGDNNPADDANVQELSDHGGSDKGGDAEKQDERIASATEEEGKDDSSMDDDEVFGGDSTSQHGGSITVKAGSGSTNGGAMVISGGIGTTDLGGSVSIESGVGTAVTHGEAIWLTLATGGDDSSDSEVPYVRKQDRVQENLSAGDVIEFFDQTAVHGE